MDGLLKIEPTLPPYPPKSFSNKEAKQAGWLAGWFGDWPLVGWMAYLCQHPLQPQKVSQQKEKRVVGWLAGIWLLADWLRDWLVVACFLGSLLAGELTAGLTWTPIKKTCSPIGKSSGFHKNS